MMAPNPKIQNTCNFVILDSECSEECIDFTMLCVFFNFYLKYILIYFNILKLIYGRTYAKSRRN